MYKKCILTFFVGLGLSGMVLAAGSNMQCPSSKTVSCVNGVCTSGVWSGAISSKKTLKAISFNGAMVILSKYSNKVFCNYALNDGATIASLDIHVSKFSGGANWTQMVNQGFMKQSFCDESAGPVNPSFCPFTAKLS